MASIVVLVIYVLTGKWFPAIPEGSSKMYTKAEMEILNEVAEDMYGCDFEELDFEEQDMLYCMLADEGRI